MRVCQVARCNEFISRQSLSHKNVMAATKGCRRIIIVRHKGAGGVGKADTVAQNGAAKDGKGRSVRFMAQRNKSIF
jgi:hypothetical protein